MSQLFPRWANSAVRAALIVGITLLAGAPIALLAWARSPSATGQYAIVEQPVAFSHPLHVNGERIDCRYCHAGAERSAMAGLPPTSACIGCHKEVLVNSVIFGPVRRSIAAAKAIPWQRVNSLPDFVFFNHAVHTRKGIGCETCHGRVDMMSRVHQVAPLTMGWCLQCHRAPEQYVRPVDEITTMGWQPTRDQQTSPQALVEKYHVRSVTTCTACHR